MAYRLAGKPQTISFGPYPSVSLADVRAKRDELKAQLREGTDPMAPRKANRAALKFKEAVSQYWEGRGDVTPSYRSNALRGIEMHLFPSLGNKPINGITRDDLLDAIRIMDAKGLYVYVRKVRMWTSQVFEWAIAYSHATINPAALIRTEKAFGKAVVTKFTASAPYFLKKEGLGSKYGKVDLIFSVLLKIDRNEYEEANFDHFIGYGELDSWVRR